MNRWPYWWQHMLFNHWKEWRDGFLWVVLFIVLKDLVLQSLITHFQDLLASFKCFLKIGTLFCIVFILLALFLRPLLTLLLTFFFLVATLLTQVTSLPKPLLFEFILGLLNLHLFPDFISLPLEFGKVSHFRCSHLLIIDHG